MDGVQLFQGYRATTRRQFTFYRYVPRRSWYSFDQPQKSEKLSWPWSHPVVLNPGPRDWKSSALITRPLLTWLNLVWHELTFAIKPFVFLFQWLHADYQFSLILCLRCLKNTIKICFINLEFSSIFHELFPTLPYSFSFYKCMLFWILLKKAFSFHWNLDLCQNWL